MKNLVSLIFIVCFSIFNSYSQENFTALVGIGATVQGTDYGINVPITVTSNIAAIPFFTVNYINKTGSDYGVGIALQYYINTNRLSPYVIARVAGLFYNPKDIPDAVAYTDICYGVGFGGEYFITPQFSIAIELQGNIISTDKNSTRFDTTDDIVFSTATTLGVTLYFGKNGE